MKSRKRGPAPPVVRGPLATLRGLRLTFCSRRRSDLFTPPATRRAPRPRPPPRVAVGIGSRATCSPLQCPPTPSSAPLSRRCPLASPARGRPRVSTLRPAHPCTSSVGQPLGADHFFSRLVASSFSVSAELLLPRFGGPTIPLRDRRGRFVHFTHFTASFHLDVVSEAKVGPVFGPC